MVTHDNSLAPRFSRHLVIQDGEIIPGCLSAMAIKGAGDETGAGPGSGRSRRKTVIQLQKVVKTFKNAAGEFTVLKGIDLTLQQGRVRRHRRANPAAASPPCST